MWKVISSFLPSGLGWWSLATVGALALSFGVWLGSALQSRETYRVEKDFASYQTEVEKSRAQENANVLSEMKGLQRSLGALTKSLTQKQVADRAFSESLIKELYDASGKSCPLSPAIEHYLDRLREHQQGARVN